MADTPSAPPLPDGSVDFNAVHSAAKRGHDLEKAVEKATFVHPEKAEAEKLAAEVDAQQAPTDPEQPADPAPSKES